jgi:hypothetical protein
VRLFTVPVEPLLHQNLRSRFLLGGEGCGTPGVTVEAIVLYSASLCSVEA